MLDGNTAALNAYELEQERKDKAYQDAESLVLERAIELITLRYSLGGTDAQEALGGEGFQEIDYFTIGGLIRCIKQAETPEVREIHRASLGRLVESKIIDYMIDAATEQAEKEILDND